MARSRSASSNLPLIAAAFSVVVVGAALGYYVLGRPLPPAASVTPTASVPAPAPAPEASRPPVSLTPHVKNSDYTAPGAPRIVIQEDRTPQISGATGKARLATRPKSDTLDIPTPDVEPAPESHPPSPAKPTRTVSETPDAPPDTPAASDTPPPAAPSDSDFEKLGARPDPEAGQEGGGSGGDRALFRVQSASFGQMKNARRLADALRERGFSPSTRTEREGDKTVYKVQIGAYRTRSAANKAALELQNNGYPAYVSPITP